MHNTSTFIWVDCPACSSYSFCLSSISHTTIELLKITIQCTQHRQCLSEVSEECLGDMDSLFMQFLCLFRCWLRKWDILIALLLVHLQVIQMNYVCTRFMNYLLSHFSYWLVTCFYNLFLHGRLFSIMESNGASDCNSRV